MIRRAKFVCLISIFLVLNIATTPKITQSNIEIPDLIWSSKVKGDIYFTESGSLILVNKEYIYRLSINNGRILWKLKNKLDDKLRSFAHLCGKIFLLDSKELEIACIDEANGLIIWENKLLVRKDDFYRNFEVMVLGEILLVNDYYYLYRYDINNGKVIWRSGELSGAQKYFCLSGKYYELSYYDFKCFSPNDGKIVWISEDYLLGPPCNSSPQLELRGDRFYSNGFDRRKDSDDIFGLVCIDPVTGKAIWSNFDNPGYILFAIGNSVITVQSDGHYPIPAKNTIIKCFNKNDGSMFWTFDIPNMIEKTMSVGNNMLFSILEKTEKMEQNYIYCINAETGKIIWKNQYDVSNYYRVVSWRNMLIVIDEDLNKRSPMKLSIIDPEYGLQVGLIKKYNIALTMCYSTDNRFFCKTEGTLYCYGYPADIIPEPKPGKNIFP